MEFWKSSGIHLTTRDENGWLEVTDDFLRAYYTRPEIHPVEDSCKAEHALFEKLMDKPTAAIEASKIEAIKDKDAADNYRVILSFRDHLIRCGSIEAGYADLFKGDAISIPPVFIDQMVHLILRNILENVDDPMRLRSAELFFREQIITVGDDLLMLADQEIVESQSKNDYGKLGQMLVETGTPMKETSLDVMTETNKNVYWERSDKFDMAIDFRFTQHAPDALGRVIEAWIDHFLKVDTRIQTVKSIKDKAWTWHVGLDAESTKILNGLYNGEGQDEDTLYRILALYRLEFLNPADTIDSLQGKPVYLGVAMTEDRKLVLKPQNLLTNLPLRQSQH